MNEQKGNIEFIEILKERRSKGLLSQLADKVTPIKQTYEEPQDYETLIEDIFADWTGLTPCSFLQKKCMLQKIVAFFKRFFGLLGQKQIFLFAFLTPFFANKR